MTLYHIDRVLARDGWTKISDKPRKYQKDTTILWTNRTGVTAIEAPSGPLEAFVPALYAPLASVGALCVIIT